MKLKIINTNKIKCLRINNIRKILKRRYKMKNKSVIQSLRKQMSNQIHNDLRPYVSPMTTAGMKSMSPSKKMTRNKTKSINTKRVTKGIASLSLATRSLRMNDVLVIPSLCINLSYINRLLTSSFFICPVYNKCILSSYTCNENNFTFGSGGESREQFINYMTRIVYTTPSTCKSSLSTNFSQNTSINNPKSPHNKLLNENLSKPIPNKTTESCGQKTRYLKADDIKASLNNWLTGIYKPTHFLTLQLPENKKSADLMTSTRHLKNIMKAFEKSLMNNWYRHHLRFIAFAENVTSADWHYHILLNQGKFTEQELQNAVFATNIREKLSSYCLKLDKIDENVLTVDAYCTKEMKIYWNGKFDSDRIIFSECLFGLKSL